MMNKSCFCGGERPGCQFEDSAGEADIVENLDMSQFSIFCRIGCFDVIAPCI